MQPLLALHLILTVGEALTHFSGAVARQILTSPSDIVLCLIGISSMRYSHQTQDSVRRRSQSLSAPMATVCFVPRLTDFDVTIGQCAVSDRNI